MSVRDILEENGRLTQGDKPLHERRKDLSNQLRTCVHSVRTTINNWPAEFELPKDHQIFELLEVMEIVSTNLETPDEVQANHSSE